jgi:phospholipid/cholesterol/gamma-HCH transport system substrate-binding protein
MENRSFALATGVFMLGLIVAALFAGNWLAGDRLERASYRVVALQPVSGLNPQGQVRYRGIGAGRVARIELDPQDSRRILIDIEVEKRIPVTRGTYAQLGQEGITGIAYVHLLDDGKLGGPPATGADGVPEIPLRSSFLDDMFDSAGGLTRDVRKLVANLNEVLNERNRRDIAETLASLKAISANLESASQRLPAALARAEGFLSEENRRAAADALAGASAAARELPALARDARQMVNSLPPLATEARQLVEDARRLAASVQRLTEEAGGATGGLREETLPRVNALAETVERGAERIGRLAGELERKPDAVLWGRPAARPGPGERGFE